MLDLIAEHINKPPKLKKEIRQRNSQNSSGLPSWKTLSVALLMLLSQGCTDLRKELGHNVFRGGDDVIYVDNSKYNAQGEAITNDIIPLHRIEDPKTFQMVDYFFGKDAKNVYAISYRLGDAERMMQVSDPATFQELEGMFYKDQYNVYYLGYGELEAINGCDPNTVRITGSQEGEYNIHDAKGDFIWDYKENTYIRVKNK